jgi:hypothetical protein
MNKKETKVSLKIASLIFVQPYTIQKLLFRFSLILSLKWYFIFGLPKSFRIKISNIILIKEKSKETKNNVI